MNFNFFQIFHALTHLYLYISSSCHRNLLFFSSFLLILLSLAEPNEGLILCAHLKVRNLHLQDILFALVLMLDPVASKLLLSFYEFFPFFSYTQVLFQKHPSNHRNNIEDKAKNQKIIIQ
jgi:hypothetical protein